MIELRPRIDRDVRGYFLETYHQTLLAGFGITDNFVQDNQSGSAKGVVRGFHYQLRHPQAKLCRVVVGEALDVALDIRVGSPYFGKSAVVLLSAKEQNQIFIPAGFAHAFLALSEDVQFLYKCSDFFDPGEKLGILWNDPSLNISWGIAHPIISEKDSQFPKLADVPHELLPRYSGK